MMKNKFLPLLLFILILNACTSSRYLPVRQDVGVSPHGANIMVEHDTGWRTYGELIAVDSLNLILLNDITNVCMSIPISSVYNFKVRYARESQFGWSVPLFTLASLSHGAFLVFTIPLNLAVTLPVSLSKSYTFKYDDWDMSIRKLQMFARYPQGIPEGVNLTDIKQVHNIE